MCRLEKLGFRGGKRSGPFSGVKREVEVTISVGEGDNTGVNSIQNQIIWDHHF